MPIHITLADKTDLKGTNNALGRAWFGWDPTSSNEGNWNANRGNWVLGKRAEKEAYALFSWVSTRKIVMAAEIHDIVDSPDVPGKKIIEGKLLDKGHPVYDEFLGQDQPESARVRNPVTYLDAPVGGWPCGCGCGTEIYAGEFVRGHEQTALHQRVAEIGTISEFLRWFDAVRAGDSSTRPYVATSVTLDGRLHLSVDSNGTTALTFTPDA
jgi:hypothetical protein